MNDDLPMVPETEVRVLTPKDVDRIAEAVHPRYKALLLFLAWSGCRIGEASELKVSNLDLLHGMVTVREAAAVVRGKIVHGQTKNKRAREIALPDFLVRGLRRHVEEFPPDESGIVFTGRHGGQINHNNFRARIWYPALEKAGISKPWPRVHHLRHTMVSLAMARGIPQKVVQSRAGHATSAMTDRYTHIFDGQDEALAAEFDRLRSAPDEWWTSGGLMVD
jgi:integrase